jgi:hypothetical protein
MEIWKPLYGFPSYNGSSEGRIMNVRTQRILKTHTDGRGREIVQLRKNNQTYTVHVHKVIAQTFLGDHPGMDVRHRDLDRSNNRVDNLYWSSRKETVNYYFENGIRAPSRCISVMVVETGEIYDSIRACARSTGCSQSEICKQLAGKRSHVKGLHFREV